MCKQIDKTNYVSLIGILGVCCIIISACTNPNSRSGNSSEIDTSPVLLSPIQSEAGSGTVAANGSSTAPDENDARPNKADSVIIGDSDLEGVWVATCRLIDGDDTAKGYRIWSLTIDGGRFSSLVRNFPTPGCVSSSATYSESLYQGYFVFGEPLLNSDGLRVNSLEVYTQTPFVSKDFDIYYISGNSLYFGDTTQDLDGTTVENRPSYLDFHWELQRSE